MIQRHKKIFRLLFLLFIFPLSVFPQIQMKSWQEGNLGDRLKQVSEAYTKTIAFDTEQTKSIRVPALKAEQYTIEQVLNATLSPTPFTFKKVSDNSFIIIPKQDDDVPQKTSFGTGSGILRGRVVENETSEPLIGATVKIVGTERGAMTNLDGYYSFDNLPAGRQTIEVAYMGYTTEQVNVNITASRTATCDVKLSPDTKILDEVIVSAVRKQRGSVPHATVGQVTQEIKELKVVASGISSEQISKSADRNAAQAVQRVAGVSIVDDKFVIVRGLNPRYNLTYLNDNIAPSTETNSRSFALDLIPSRVIDKIIVQKSPSPDVQADATGGVVKIYTKDARAVKHFDIDFQLGHRPGTSFNADFLTYNGGKLDFLGFDDGTRALPSSVPGYGSLVKAQLLPSQYAQAFNPTLTYAKTTTLPNMQFTANYYDAWSVFGKTLSMLASLSYKNENVMNHIYRQAGDGYNSFDTTDKMGEEDASSNTVQSNLLLNFNLRLNDQNILSFKNFFLQQGVDKTNIRDSWNTGYLSNPVYGVAVGRDISLTYNQRFLYAGNLSGMHRSKNEKHELNWNGGFLYSRQSTPDQRVVRLTGTHQGNGIGDNELRWFARGAAPVTTGNYSDPVPLALGIISRFWSLNSDKVYNASLDYNYKITPWLAAKIGTFQQWKERALDRRIFTVHEGTMSGPGSTVFSGYSNSNLIRFRMQDLPEVWSPTYLTDDYSGLQVFDRTSGSDTYRGTEQNNSAYFLLNLTPANRIVEIYGGMRYEYNRQKIAAAIPADRNKYPVNYPILVDNPTHSWLPSVNASLRPSKAWVIRASYGQTVNRTEFREVSPFQEMDFANNQILKGNSGLKSAEAENWDARIEFYPKEENGDAISVGLFYKDIQRPIERVNTTNRVESNFPTITFDNALSATVKGMEVELRKSFDFIPLSFFRNLSLSTNASWIKSVAKYDASENPNFPNIKERPLQGQSPYLINAGLYYENAGWGSKIGVIYNISGNSIYAVGRDYRYNPYIRGPLNRGSLIELSRHLLDFSYTQRIGKGMQLKLTIQNILDEPVTIIEDFNYSNKYEPMRETPIITEVESGDGKYTIKDYGDNISSEYKPGRYFSLSFSYSF